MKPVVAFQGIAGANSDLAIRQHFGEDVEIFPCRTLEDVFGAIHSNHEVVYGLLPVENVHAGAVTQAYELLMDADFRIQAEILLHVHHALLATPGCTLEEMCRVRSHPHALAQCQRFLKRNNLDPVQWFDTAGSARDLADKPDAATGAIATELAGELYGLELLESGIEDSDFNFTRFFLLGHEDPPMAEYNKTSIVFATRQRPAALYDCLGEFASRNINLTKLESRPRPNRPWEPMFYLDFEGHWQEPHVQEMMAGLLQRASFVKSWALTRLSAPGCNWSEFEVLRMEKLGVAILGATGAVGQRFVQLLQDHPWFDVVELTGSSSAGREYGEAVRWRLEGSPPDEVAGLRVKPSDAALESQLVFSALPTAAAHSREFELAAAGHVVCTNASANRMQPDVPLLLPEANADHIGLIDVQRAARGFRSGAVVANSNCTSMPVVMSLAPLRRFGIRKIHMVSEQAISGAGYPGVASLDIIDNVIPWVSGDEGKMESEPRKMLGELVDGEVAWLPAISAATCTRVPVIDGHLVNISLELDAAPTLDKIHAAWRDFQGPQPVPLLPSAPERPLQVFTQNDRPQIRLDRMAGGGMSTAVGRLRECPILGYRFAALTHNTIRGAAGCSILNAELLAVEGYLGAFQPLPALAHA